MPPRESANLGEPAPAAEGIRRAARDPVLESLTAAIAVYDASRHLVAFNAAYATMFGLDPVWLETAPEFSLVFARLRERRMLPEMADVAAYRNAQLALFGAGPAASEEMLHLPDGRSLRHVLRRHPRGGLIMTYEDLSRPLALERDRNAQEAVRRVTLDALATAVAAIGGDGRLRLANAAFRRLWRLDADTDARLADLAVRMAAGLTGDGAGALADLVAATHERRGERHHVACADGRTLEGATAPLPDGAMLLTFDDATNRLRVETALAERDAAFAAAEQAKTAFIANVSFEVRGPLNALSGFSELLADEAFGPLNPRQRSYAESIRDSASGLSAIIADVLDLAAIEAGQTRLDLRPVDVPALLAQALGLVRERARTRQVTVAMDCPPDLGAARADAGRLKQIVLELLDNALAHTPPRGTVTVSAGQRDGGIEIAVADTGSGVARADRERIFQPFERAAPADGALASGAGLGLAVARRFIDMHGGRIELSSRPGRGTVVRCWLPSP